MHGHLGCRHEHAGRDQTTHDRRAEQRAILELHPGHSSGPLPRRERDEDERRGPHEVEQRAFGVGTGSSLVQVDPVADRVEEQAGGHQRPGATGPPAGNREHEDEEREQEHVPDRIGHVRHDHEPAPVRGVEDDLDENGRPDRACGRGSHEPVEPEARAERRQAPAQEERDPDVEERVEGEIRDIRRGRERRTAAVPEVEEDVADRGGEQAGPDETPRGALGAHEDRAGQDAEGCEELDPLVEPRLAEARPARRETSDIGHGKRGDAGDENRLPDPQGRGGAEVGRSFHRAEATYRQLLTPALWALLRLHRGFDARPSERRARAERREAQCPPMRTPATSDGNPRSRRPRPRLRESQVLRRPVGTTAFHDTIASSA